jgi:hypothetical protein
MIATQATETLSLITTTLNIQLNIGQSMTMNTTAVFVSLETASIAYLSNKLIQQADNSLIRMPSIFNSSLNTNASVLFRVSLFYYPFLNQS